MSDKMKSSKQFCRQFLSPSSETSCAQKIEKDVPSISYVVSVWAITIHRLNQKVENFNHKLFMLRSID
jgi:hypothetical protein